MKQKKPSISEHLASLSVQYNVYPTELFNALVYAREHGKTSCEGLTVEYRGSVDKEAIFLIKQKENVVVQFRVAEEILLQKDIAFDKWMDTDKIRRQIAKQAPSGPISTQIRDLRHGMKKINLKAEVLETQKPKQVHTQFGNAVMMTNATIGDESGKIKLLLWDQQVNAVATGDIIEIKNASVSTFKGEKQLRLGKTGTLTVTQSGVSKEKNSDESGAKKIVCA